MKTSIYIVFGEWYICYSRKIRGYIYTFLMKQYNFMPAIRALKKTNFMHYVFSDSSFFILGKIITCHYNNSTVTTF